MTANLEVDEEGCDNLLNRYDPIVTVNLVGSQEGLEQYRNLFHDRSRPLSFEYTSNQIDLDGDGKKEIIGIKGSSLPRSYKLDYSQIFIFEVENHPTDNSPQIGQTAIKSNFKRHGFHNIDGPTFSEPDRLVFEKNGLEIPNLASAIVSLGLIEDTPILKMKADISAHESSDTEPAASKPVTILVKVMSSQILSALCFQIDIPN